MHTMNNFYTKVESILASQAFFLPLPFTQSHLFPILQHPPLLSQGLRSCLIPWKESYFSALLAIFYPKLNDLRPVLTAE